MWSIARHTLFNSYCSSHHSSYHSSHHSSHHSTLITSHHIIHHSSHHSSHHIITSLIKHITQSTTPTPTHHINFIAITPRGRHAHHANHVHSQFLQIPQLLHRRCECAESYSLPLTTFITVRSPCKGRHMHVVHHNVRQSRIHK